MATLTQTLTLKDKFSSSLNSINNTIDRTIGKFSELDRRVKKMTQTATIKVKADMPKNLTAPKVSSPATSMLGRMVSISRALNFMVAIQALRQMANLMSGLIKSGDDYIQTMARLKTIEDGSKTGQELQDSIMAAAQRSRTGFGIMADSVAKLRSQAGEAFKSNDEAIAFAEQLNKLYKIGGASLEQQKAGTLQITQALASGVLRGDEFNSMMENAPLVAQKLARHLGVSVGQLRAMAKDGQLTGDTLKNALLGSAVETNAEFAKMPMTFADMMTQVGNVASYAFQPLIQAWQEFINSTAGQNFMAGLETAMFAIGQIALWLFNLFVAGWNWVTENINFVITALELLATVAAWAGYVAFVAWALANWPLLLMIGIVLLISKVLADMGVSFADVAATIIAMIVYIAEAAYNNIQFIINLFIFLGSVIINVFIGIWNAVITVAEAIANTFLMAVWAVKKAFATLAKAVLGAFAAVADGAANVATAIGNAFIAGANMAIKAINWIIKALNKIPGVNLGTVGEIGAMSYNGGLGSSIRGLADGLDPGSAPEKVSFAGMKGKGLELHNPTEGLKNPMLDSMAAYQGTKNFFNGIGDAMKGFGDKMKKQDELASKFDQANQTPAGAGVPDGGGGGGKGLGDKLGKGKNIGNVGKIEDEVKLKDEDIKMMRDVAERKYIIDYQVLTTQVSVNYESKNSATEQDINDLVGKIEDKIVGLVNSDLGIA